MGLAFWDVDQVYGTPCRWKSKSMVDPGTTIGGLAAALSRQPLRNATAPTNFVLAGALGKYVRLSVPRHINFAHCDKGYFESWTGLGWARDRWEQGPGQVDRVWILNVLGQRLVVDANYLPSPPGRIVPSSIASYTRSGSCGLGRPEPLLIRL